jgi:hypothetical protein
VLQFICANILTTSYVFIGRVVKLLPHVALRALEITEKLNILYLRPAA